MTQAPLYMLVGIGLVAGVLSGVFGIGGGVIIVPALMYLTGFPQKVAIGTSLAVLLPPVGIAAVAEYYRHGNVNLHAALIIAVTLAAGGWVGALIANRVDGPYLRLAFGLFVLALGVYFVAGAARRLSWI